MSLGMLLKKAGWGVVCTVSALGVMTGLALGMKKVIWDYMVVDTAYQIEAHISQFALRRAIDASVALYADTGRDDTVTPKERQEHIAKVFNRYGVHKTYHLGTEILVDSNDRRLTFASLAEHFTNYLPCADTTQQPSCMMNDKP